MSNNFQGYKVCWRWFKTETYGYLTVHLVYGNKVMVENLKQAYNNIIEAIEACPWEKDVLFQSTYLLVADVEVYDWECYPLPFMVSSCLVSGSWKLLSLINFYYSSVRCYLRLHNNISSFKLVVSLMSGCTKKLWVPAVCRYYKYELFVLQFEFACLRTCFTSVYVFISFSCFFSVILFDYPW